MSDDSSDEEFEFGGGADNEEEEDDDEDHQEEDDNNDAPPPTKKTNKKRKLQAQDDDDDDDDSDDSDDDKPLVALKKKKDSNEAEAARSKKPTKKLKISLSANQTAKAAAAAGRAKGKSKSSEDDDDDDDDEPISKTIKVKKEKANAATASAAAKKKTPKVSPDSSKKVSGKKTAKKRLIKREDDESDNDRKPAAKSAKTGRELKKLDKTERLQNAMQAFLWWEAPVLPKGVNWSTMEHAGVSFPEEYEPHGVLMLYDGEPIELTPEQEEAATFFAAMDPDGMHLGKASTAKIFTNNFFADFKVLLGKKHVIQSFDKCDFGPIRRHLEEQKKIKKAITDEQKAANKQRNSQIVHKFGFALVDGHIEKVGNFNMEPPGAFRGRGEHPKMGKLKNRVWPEQVSLNMSEGAAVPQCPAPGHAWGDIKHDPAGQWLATWKENINGQSKYMQLAAQSSFKGKSDRAKYSKAALLCKYISKIRKSYKKDLKSKDTETKQLATATWVIDRLALRVGGEKDTDEEADTVGCCSLRVEHLTFDPNDEGGDNREIELEFLGKDSMLFKQTIDFGAELYNDDNGMGQQVFENLKSFCKKKSKTDEVFQAINPTLLNAHLKKFMDGLTAKVFRTYNASKTLQDELRKAEQSALWHTLSPAEKVVEYNNANREVAILCNHQRSVSKAQETQLESISGKISTLKTQLKELKRIGRNVRAGNTDKKDVPLRKSLSSMEEGVKKALEKAKKMKERATTDEEKIKATEADEAAKKAKRDLATEKFETMHLWEKVPNEDQVKKKVIQWKEKISKMEMDLKHKDDNKEVSLGTSKINYMDPRISVAWCKRHDVPIEKIFSKTLRDKFNWAMAVEADWEFNETIGQLEA